MSFEVDLLRLGGKATKPQKATSDSGGEAMEYPSNQVEKQDEDKLLPLKRDDR